MKHRLLVGLLVVASAPALVSLPLSSAGNPEPPPRPLKAAPALPSAWLGVYLGQGTRSPQGDETPGQAVVQILGVLEGSPAEGAGLRARDHILTVDGLPVASSRELISLVGSMESGRWITLTVERNGEEMELSARLVERPGRGRPMRVRAGWIGLESIDLPDSLRNHFGALEGTGVMISHVEPGSPAEAAGFELGDVVYQVDGEPVPSAKRLEERVVRGGIGNTLEIVLMRHGSEITVEAAVALAPEDETRR